MTPEAALFIGKPNEGHISNYYLGKTILDDEVANIQAAAEKMGIDILNTRFAAVLYSTLNIDILIQREEGK